MTEKLNKIQIRAMVFDIIKSYKSDADFEKKLHQENIRKLNNVEDKKFICEILLKELLTRDLFEKETIQYLLADFATLELVENTIWNLLYNPDITDEQKGTYLQLLRALGGKVSAEEVMDCFHDMDNVVDQQTQGFLEIAAINPEAQIDFLDFLMSLRTTEQLILIKSLSEDFKSDEMANMLTPCLRMPLDKEVKEEILNIFGHIPSYLSVKPLKTYINTAGDEELKRTALKALNKIKEAGIDIDDNEVSDFRENEICRETSFYKAFLSQVDGCGNQGLIFSRISKQEKVIMFSTVINVVDGVMDCFGLYNISINDFLKVVSRFKANDMVVPITAEVAKAKLMEAEKRSENLGSTLPYEYFCWNVYTCDIKENPIDYDALLTEETDITIKELYQLYDSGIFDSWYFEFDDNIKIQELITFATTVGENAEEPVSLIENKIDEIFYSIFTFEKIAEYSQMLLDSAFIFYMNNDFEKANLAANVSEKIKKGNTEFLKDTLRRSILQHFATIIAQDGEEQEENIFSQKNETKKLTAEQAFKLLKEFERTWDNALYE